MKTTILLADNNVEHLNTTSEVLERAGYKVLTASDPLHARQILEDKRIDLAILDLRLREDTDKEDFSGLDIAKEVDLAIPKIILTQYPSASAERDALTVNSKGLPPVVRFVYKQEGSERLLQAVREGLALAKWLRRSLDVVVGQIDRDYQEANRQASINYWTSLVVALLGIGIIAWGTILGLRQELAVGIVSAAAGLLTEGIGYLFFRRLDDANKRMDRYHTELLQIQRFEILLAASAELPTERENISKEKVIQRATDYWLNTPTAQFHLPLSETTEQVGP